MGWTIAAAGAALVVTASMTPLIGALARRWGVLDRPAERKVHLTPTPLLGGLAILAGTALAVVVMGGDGRALLILSIGAGLMAVGILDDLGILHAQVKLMLAMPL